MAQVPRKWRYRWLGSAIEELPPAHKAASKARRFGLCLIAAAT
jgi:hypothetical protein